MASCPDICTGTNVCTLIAAERGPIVAEGVGQTRQDTGFDLGGRGEGEVSHGALSSNGALDPGPVELLAQADAGHPCGCVTGSRER